MESNSNDNYVLVLEDRTEVTNEKEAGKLSVVSGIDDKGNLKTTEAVAANQAAFLKFSNKDGLLKNFMTNFLKQFNNPDSFWTVQGIGRQCGAGRGQPAYHAAKP